MTTGKAAASTARRLCAIILGVSISIGGGTIDFRGAEARARIHCPPWPLYLACAFTVGLVTSIGAGLFGARSVAAQPRSQCPPGHIYRVSKKACEPKGAEPKLSAATRTSTEPPLPPRREIFEDGSAPPRSPERPHVDSAPTHDVPRPAAAKAPQSLRAEASTFDHKGALERILRLGSVRDTTTVQLEDLVAFCRMALKSYRRTDAPFQWAAVRNNLANALVALEERKNGTEGFEEAVALYREALTERTRESAPRDWATIQTNLGAVLTILGLKENAVSKLAEAAVVKREALVWAKRTGDEGVALMRVAEQQGDKDKARIALAQIDTALTTIQDGDQGSLVAAYFEEQLPKARALVEQLSEPRATELPLRTQKQ